MKCPKCGSNTIETTLMGFMNAGKPCKDDNYATCHKCGHKGKAWEFGAPDRPPIKGTEDWSDEKIEQWHKDWKEGNIEIRTEIGSGVVCEWFDESLLTVADKPLLDDFQDSSIILPKKE